MYRVGDRVEIAGRKVGQQPRKGVVTDVLGSMLRVKWDTGEQTTFIPSAGSLSLVSE